MERVPMISQCLACASSIVKYQVAFLAHRSAGTSSSSDAAAGGEHTGQVKARYDTGPGSPSMRISGPIRIVPY